MLAEARQCSSVYVLTSWIVAGSQQNTTGRLPYPNDMAGCWCTENAVLTDQELLDAVCGTNLCNHLSDLWVPVAAITTNDEERILDALGDGEEDTGDERLRVVLLLEDLDLLAESRTVQMLVKIRRLTYRAFVELRTLRRQPS